VTPANNLVVLPNSTLAKIGLTNLTKPDESHLIILPIRITSDSRPAEAKATCAELSWYCRKFTGEKGSHLSLSGALENPLEGPGPDFRGNFLLQNLTEIRERHISKGGAPGIVGFPHDASDGARTTFAKPFRTAWIVGSDVLADKRPTPALDCLNHVEKSQLICCLGKAVSTGWAKRGVNKVRL
jgi:hypothetical protein